MKQHSKVMLGAGERSRSRSRHQNACEYGVTHENELKTDFCGAGSVVVVAT